MCTTPPHPQASPPLNTGPPGTLPVPVRGPQGEPQSFWAQQWTQRPGCQSWASQATQCPRHEDPTCQPGSALALWAGLLSTAFMSAAGAPRMQGETPGS